MERFPTSTYDYEPVLLTLDQTCQAEKSGTCAACEQMIQMSFMVMGLSTLDQILEGFEKNGHLTHMEHQSLLELAKRRWNTNELFQLSW